MSIALKISLFKRSEIADKKFTIVSFYALLNFDNSESRVLYHYISSFKIQIELT